MSFWRLYYHLIWTTKNREPLIQPEMERRLFAYLIAKAAELDVYTYAINGWYDHLHLVVAIPPKIAVADVVKHIKGASAYDINHTYGLSDQFAWQRGYGALSLGERQRSRAEDYVRNQKQHHQQQTTNSWLEHVPDGEEGPIDTGLSQECVPTAVREHQAEYTFTDDVPF